jgi:hypothetical protein
VGVASSAPKNVDLIVLEKSTYQTHWIEGHQLSSELPGGERNRDESGSEVGQPLPRLSLVGFSARWKPNIGTSYTSFGLWSSYWIR